MLSTRQLRQCLCVCLLLAACNREKIQPLSDEARAFLQQNKAGLDWSRTQSAAPLFSANDLSRCRLFLIGEHHATGASAESHLFFVKLLHQQAGARYLLLELGYADGQLFNTYLQTGDEDLLTAMYRNYGRSFEGRQEKYAFWQKLRAFNLTLPEGQRLVVVGCDVEHSGTTALRYLKTLLPATPAPATIAGFVDWLKAQNGISYANHKGQITALVRDLETNQGVWEDYLRGGFWHFAHTVRGMKNAAVYYTETGMNMDERERIIFSNFKELYPRMTDGKIVGQWGTYHVIRNATHTSLAQFIRQDLTLGLSDKMLCIYPLYADCWYSDQNLAVQPANTLNANGGALKEMAESPVTLFRLQTPDSPLRRELYWWPGNEQPNGGTTCDYFDYVLLVQQSDAMKPFGG